MPIFDEIPKVVRLAETIKKAEKAAELAKQATQPLRIPHPLKPGEFYTFAPGTDPKVANDIVKMMLLRKARHGEQTIELPSDLTPARLADLKKKEDDLTKAQTIIQDMEKRKDLTKVSPGLYQDEATGLYWRVTSEGRIEKVSK